MLGVILSGIEVAEAGSQSQVLTASQGDTRVVFCTLCSLLHLPPQFKPRRCCYCRVDEDWRQLGTTARVFADGVMYPHVGAWPFLQKCIHGASARTLSPVSLGSSFSCVA